ncbi:cell division control 14, SIN component [Saccharata proteae CBS 121410]|uniref:Cell division control 14, SIN component n=1 Tax=Saccharata proteae CBS 121410 TaxID=1314787 RepID=A0A9P4LUB9_9PEZI|nr:cell division control 14, SIN component [Saccharata proteae CBS 121410]
MEHLLSVSFDNITSKDFPRIRKGLKQIEGLLAQICLSKPAEASQSRHRRTNSAVAPSSSPSKGKQLAHLPEDPAFREFFRLQEGFEWNIASRLITCLEWLLSIRDGHGDSLIMAALDILQGILLLHPPSRSHFAREIYMNLLLDLIDYIDTPAIQCRSLLVLVTALLSTPANTRTFEDADGLLAVTSLFKSSDTAPSVKLKLMEFFYFYLMPETPSRGSSRLFGAFEKRSERGSKGEDARTRTIEEKQQSLGQHLSNVQDLVEDLRENMPFGEGGGVAIA